LRASAEAVVRPVNFCVPTPSMSLAGIFSSSSHPAPHGTAGRAEGCSVLGGCHIDHPIRDAVPAVRPPTISRPAVPAIHPGTFRRVFMGFS